METVMEVVETYLRRNANLSLKMKPVDTPRRAAIAFQEMFGENNKNAWVSFVLTSRTSQHISL